MLRPSRPMMRPFISSDGMGTTETVISAVWSTMTRWMAVTTTSRARSSADSRAERSMDRASRTASCSASSRTCSRSADLAWSDGHLADPLQGDDLLLAGAAQLLALRLQLLLLDQQLPVALLEHVRALVELLVPLEQPALEVGQVGALGATLLLQLALESDLLLLGLEDQVLLLGACLRDDATGLVLGGLDRLVGDDAAGDEADGQTADDRRQHDHDGDDIVHRSLPSGPGIRRCMHRQAGGWEPLRTVTRHGHPAARRVLSDGPPRSRVPSDPAVGYGMVVDAESTASLAGMRQGVKPALGHLIRVMQVRPGHVHAHTRVEAVACQQGIGALLPLARIGLSQQRAPSPLEQPDRGRMVGR